jgi:hypothetical protein
MKAQSKEGCQRSIGCEAGGGGKLDKRSGAQRRLPVSTIAPSPLLKWKMVCYRKEAQTLVMQEREEGMR